MSGVTEKGAILANAKQAAFEGCYVNSNAPLSEPLLKSTYSEFKELHKADNLMIKQLQNNIKLCAECHKSCAFNMSHCNNCDSPLPEVVSHSDNVFMAFVYGVPRGRFPYKISVRYQDPDILVFDDLLAMTPCHLNCINTNLYIPDWRFLLLDPKFGAKVIDRMENALWGEAVKFWENEGFKNKIIKPGTIKDIATLKKCIVAGCNFPPSQFQFHIQYMLLPLLPSQYSMYLNGKHYTEKRFFPLEYVKAVLKENIAFDIKMDTSIDDIISTFDKAGVSYKKYWNEMYAGVAKIQKAIGNWSDADFKGKIEGDTVIPDSGLNKKSQVNADKLVLQNYGRPYQNGKPTGTFYKYAKRTRIPEFAEVVSASRAKNDYTPSPRDLKSALYNNSDKIFISDASILETKEMSA